MEEQNLTLPLAETRRLTRRSAGRIGWALALYMGLTSLVQILLAALFTAFWPAVTEQGWYVWALSYLPQLVIALPAAWAVLKKGQTAPAEKSSLGALRWLRLLVIGEAMMYAGNLVSTGLTALLEGLTGASAANAVEEIVTGSDLWATLLFAVILAPLTEELLFRRLIAERLRPYGDKTALLLSAALFALMHASLYQFVYAFLLGLVLGYAYLRTGRLRASLGIHMGLNFLGSVLPMLLMQGMERLGLSLEALEDMDTQALIDCAAENPAPILLFGAYALVLLALVATGVVLLAVYAREIRLESPTRIPEKKTALVLNWGVLVFALLSLLLTAASFL